MTFNEYQKQAMKTDYNLDGDRSIQSIAFIEHVLGLVGESGEFADKVKKIYRNNQKEMSEAERIELLKELGDVLWYVSSLASYMDAELETVADKNLKKLADRAKRNVIASKGDNR
jgi:NTP pyrophosphatase (non-canonical NTP hydrolase)